MTGYTHKVPEGQTFEEFALGCARAFGALVTMRDAPSDAPIPDEFVPDEHHADALARARAQKAAWDAMSDDERAEWARTEIDARRKDHQDHVTRKLNVIESLNSMLAQVQAWTPPTPDHREYKAFMVQQLTDSIGWERPSAYTEPTPMEVVNKRTEHLAWEIDYHERELQKEIERCKSRTAWVRSLKESLMPKEAQV